MTRQTILLTGVAGFIGSSLVSELLHSYNVIGVDNLNDDYNIIQKQNNISSAIKNKYFTFYKSDLRNIDQVQTIFNENNIDIVIHLAGKAGVRPSIINPRTYIENNIIATLNILEQMQLHDIHKMIFASSSSVYGNIYTNTAVEDITPLNPISPYAMTKVTCENLIYTYTQKYNLNAICLRFFTVYGPKQRPDLAIHKFYNNIVNNIPIDKYGDGTTSRDYTYIKDIIEGIISAIHYSKTRYENINLAGGNTISLNEMINTLEKVIGIKAIVNELPPQYGDVNKTSGNIQKAYNLLGYKPKTSFEDGIKQFVEWKQNEYTN